MADNYATFIDGLNTPHRDAVSITPSNTIVIDDTKAVYAGGAGTLKVTTSKGNDVTFVVIAGGLLPIRVTKIFATGTTATLIVALY